MRSRACCTASRKRTTCTPTLHMRLMITRGKKKTPYKHPSNTIGGPTVVVVAEHKVADPNVSQRGITLFTASTRRPPPDALDAKLNCHSKLHEVIALIQAVQAGADEALMLDPTGAVATCNATNFFIVVGGAVWTSTGLYCMNGITRRAVLALCEAHKIPHAERPFSLTDVYGADEAFVTGTFGGLTPVTAVDGRTIGDGTCGPMTARLSALYKALHQGRGRDALMRLSVWSGPRNVSTALMYSFRQRSDTTVIDEPLYAHYLRITGLPHPGAEDVLRSQDPDGDAVCREVLHGAHERPVVFFKNMAHHWLALPKRYLQGMTHVFLVRDPSDMLASLTVQLPECDIRATGLPDQLALYEELASLNLAPVVVQAEDIRREPRRTLTALCDHLGLVFEERMLSWPAAKPEDGVWAIGTTGCTNRPPSPHPEHPVSSRLGTKGYSMRACHYTKRCYSIAFLSLETVDRIKRWW